jgi:hypothetical protein
VTARVNICALLGILALAPVQAHAEARPTVERFAWTGLERGPLSPAEARRLEGLLLDELDGYDAFRLVDAAGHALDARLLAADAARVARLKEEGVAAYLRFEHAEAVTKLGQALAVFEGELTGLVDYELLHDTLLARAEAQYQAGEKGAAKATLQNWLALSPRAVPTTETHPKGFVQLYQDAKRQVGPVGRIQVSCEDPGCQLQLDGRPLGEAPQLLTKILPGQHYLVARWPYAVLPTVVRVAPGREATVVLRRDGPAEEARQALQDVLRLKQGVEEAQVQAKRVAGLARAERVLVARVHAGADGARALLLAHHDADGDLTAVVRAPLAADLSSPEAGAAVRQAGAALFVDRREGELDLEPSRGVRPARGLAALLYRGQGSAEAALALAPPPPEGAWPPPPPPPAEEDSVLTAWWLWAAIGVVAVGAGVTVGVVATRKDPTTTTFEVRLP